uniref:Secreted protein n=1 Tax=Neolamprologus brichardi TaxID=32507 RepID=A0A3Q4GH92_NEOBR
MLNKQICLLFILCLQKIILNIQSLAHVLKMRMLMQADLGGDTPGSSKLSYTWLKKTNSVITSNYVNLSLCTNPAVVFQIFRCCKSASAFFLFKNSQGCWPLLMYLSLISLMDLFSA